MSEEIEDTNALDSFSFFDVLEGTSYPEDSVTVSLNEKAAHQAKKLLLEYQTLENPDEKTLNKFKDDLDKVRADIEKSRVTFDLRGVDAERVTSARDIVEEMFVDKKKTFPGADGRMRKFLPEEHAMDYARMMNAVVMSMYITRVTYHGNGKQFIGLSADEVARFFDKAPSAAKTLLANAVSSLQVDASAYESELDEGFFQKS